jgi:hypothetical protein
LDGGTFEKAKIILAVLWGIILPNLIGTTCLFEKSSTASAAHVLVALPQIYYSDTIKNIILSDCARCHSGPSRNFMDYDSLKAYADSGVLGGMVQGPMAPFAGNDAGTILDWIDAGAPEKPSNAAAGFSNTQGRGMPQNRRAATPGNSPSMMLVKASKVYYSDTIKNIVLSDCAKCHSGTSRNLMDYDNLQAYADSGMLAIMVQGPMRRFAGNDAQTILDWVDAGAPEKPAATTAGFANPLNRAGTRNSQVADPPIAQNTMLAGTSKVYYSDTIENIILSDCSQCHSGPSRNLTDYDNLKAYADSGILGAMVRGPMAGYAGNDAQTMLDWIDAGTPEKPSATTAAFTNAPCPAGPGNLQGNAQGSQNTQITYENTIQYVLAADCLRCHSSQFRNLATYKNVKIYVDNGLLESLVQPGGQMHRFAGPDTRFFLMWLKNGAPRGSKPL